MNPQMDIQNTYIREASERIKDKAREIKELIKEEEIREKLHTIPVNDAFDHDSECRFVI